MNRRGFLLSTGTVGLTACWPGGRPPAKPARPRLRSRRNPTFRTITYNILAARGYPERKENRERLAQARPRMAERLALELAVYDADLITFQESPAEAMVAEIAGHLEMNYAWFPGGFPGSVLTSHKILSSVNRPAASGESLSDDLFSRHWGKATLQVGDRQLVVYTAHLHPSRDELRARECQAMVNSMADDLAAGHSVIMQGDLNESPDNSPLYRQWNQSGLQDAFSGKGTGEGLTCNSTNPQVRIDYIWSAGPISQTLSQCRVLAEGPFIDHPGDLAGFALSDHLPVMATFNWP